MFLNTCLSLSSMTSTRCCVCAMKLDSSSSDSWSLSHLVFFLSDISVPDIFTWAG